MIVPFPHQIVGAEFLAPKSAALLADEPRVGKTGAAIRAADYRMARSTLTITTATARAQWGREWAAWGFPRSIYVCYGVNDLPPPDADCVVVGWHEYWQEPLFSALHSRMWDVVIPDEAHNAANIVSGEKPTRRTVALYGKDGIAQRSGATWPLTGTPMPNGNPMNLWPMLRGLAPERLGEFAAFEDFKARYCIVKERFVAGRTVTSIIDGKNLDELNQRLGGFWMRRTQQDVGINPPIYSVFALHVDNVPPALFDDVDAQAVLDAAETGETRSLEMHLGTIRRLTGRVKAPAVIAAAKEAFVNGLDKLVLMAWHTEVIDDLRKGLAAYGVCGIDGRTVPHQREVELALFNRQNRRVFIGQMQAAGEAIDLSAAAELWFVEADFAPKNMAQASLRITNLNQKRQALVRLCAVAGSIDEALMSVLARKVGIIRQTLEQK